MPSNGLDTLPNAFHINKLFELQKKISAPATPVTPDTPLPLGTFPSADQSYCPQHNDLLRVFCCTCNKLICRDCAITTQHRNHDYNLVSDLYPLAEKAILEKRSASLEKVQAINPTIDVIKSREQKIRNKGEALKQAISRHTDKMVEDLLQAKMKLRDEVDKTVDMKCKWLRIQREDISDTLDQMIKTCNSAEKEVNNSNKVSLLAHKRNLECDFDTVNKQISKLALVPIEDDTIQFTQGHSILPSIGQLDTTCFSDECSVQVSTTNSRASWVAGVSRTLTLTITTSGNTVIPTCLLSIVVQNADNHSTIKSSLLSVDQSEYTIQFTPLVSGGHNVRVFVCEREIPGSPILVMVTYSPCLEGRRSQVITRLNKPHGCVVTDDTIMVAEYGAHCITFLDTQGQRISSICSKGTLPGQLLHPRGLAMMTNPKRILVTDDHRVQQLTMDGRVIASVGASVHGPGKNEFYTPTGIAVNPSTGTIYVADTDNNRIQVLNDKLQVMTSFGRSSIITERLKSPYSVALDNAGDVYVADSWNHCIKKYSPKGRLLCQISSEGEKPGRLKWPTSLAFNSYEYLYVTEQDNCRVSVYSKDGQILECYKENLTSGFGGPQDVYTDVHGNVYVSDSYNNKLHVFYT